MARLVKITISGAARVVDLLRIVGRGYGTGGYDTQPYGD